MSEKVKPSNLVEHYSDDFLIELYREHYENLSREISSKENGVRWMSVIATELINRGWTIREEVELVFNKEDED